MKNEIDILLENYEYELIFGKQSLLLTVEVGTKKIEKYYKDNYGDRKAEEFLLKFKKNYQEIKNVSDHQLRRVENLTEIIYVFLTIFLYLLKCPQSLILSALRAFCFCGKPHISRSIFLYFRYQAWLKSW